MDITPQETYVAAWLLLFLKQLKAYRKDRDQDHIDQASDMIENGASDLYTQGAISAGTSITNKDAAYAVQDFVSEQQDALSGFADDIVPPSGSKKDPIKKKEILSRAAMYANALLSRFWSGMVDQAPDGSLVEWMRGPTKDSCESCIEMEKLGPIPVDEFLSYNLLPQSYDLECHGYHCQCYLNLTTNPVRGYAVRPHRLTRRQSMSKTMMKPIHLFAGITRVDAAKREVEGKFYTKAKVGDGYDLPPETVERMLPGYMMHGTGPIRAMHNPHIAAGQALSVSMDKENGQKIGRVLAKITDDAEWKKVEDGTYKGFSLGATPKVLRGSKVTDGDLIEISLVDRPWDDGATFETITRGAGLTVEDPEILKLMQPVEVRVKRSNPGDEIDLTDPDSVMEAMITASAESNPEIRRIKMKKLAKAVGKIAKVKATLNASNMYYGATPTFTRGTAPAAQLSETNWQARALAAEAREKIMVERCEKLEKKLRKTVSRSKQADGELKILRSMPASARPVRNASGLIPNPAGINREFAANDFNVNDIAHFGAEQGNGYGAQHVEQLTRRYREIAEIRAKGVEKLSESEQKSLAAEIGVLKSQMIDAGIDTSSI